MILGYLIGGPPSIEPDFDKETGISLQGKDKTVAVVCFAPRELLAEFPASTKRSPLTSAISWLNTRLRS